jgi:hypothetical protein
MKGSSRVRSTNTFDPPTAASPLSGHITMRNMIRSGGVVYQDRDELRRARGLAAAKRALGPGEAQEMLGRLERCGLGSTHLLLAACIHRFLAADRADRVAAVGDYLRWSARDGDPVLDGSAARGGDPCAEA